MGRVTKHNRPYAGALMYSLLLQILDVAYAAAVYNGVIDPG